MCKSYISLGNIDNILYSINIFMAYVLMFILGLGIYFYVAIIEKEQKRLKMTGICYDAEILKISPILFFKIKGYFSFTVKCKYKNQDGEECFVKSRLLCLKKSSSQLIINTGKPKNINYKAVVYVNYNEPRKYYVEVTIE